MAITIKKYDQDGKKKEYYYEQFLLPSDSPEAQYIREQAFKANLKPTKWLERAVRKMMKK